MTATQWLQLSTILRTESFGGVKEVIKIRLYKKSPVEYNGGYMELWLAVINQAVNDYRNYPQMRSEVARFLKSNYFEKMTGVNGQIVLDRLKKEINNE